MITWKKTVDGRVCFTYRGEFATCHKNESNEFVVACRLGNELIHVSHKTRRVAANSIVAHIDDYLEDRGIDV